MNILNIFKSLAENKEANIGIGLGGLETQDLKIFNASKKFLKEYGGEIHLFGKKESFERLNEELASNLILKESNEPEKELIKSLTEGEIQAIIRGSLSSSKFLTQVKETFNTPIVKRLALLETHDRHQFFYGPVGIDECNTTEKKISFIESAIKILESFQITPKISVLSGGRRSDLGRDANVDETIKIAEKVVKYFNEKKSNLIISHDEILIEKAIKDKSNLIVAPEGISGNLIYRTLVHLGAGKAHGAIYMDIEKPIIDTSRVGKVSEIIGALFMAVALTH